MTRCLNIIKNGLIFPLLIATSCCWQAGKAAEETLHTDCMRIKIVPRFGTGYWRYFNYWQWYLPKYLIELKGETWYRDSVIKPMMSSRNRIDGIVRVNRDGQFNIIRNVGLNNTLQELCDYLTQNHKMLVFDYTSGPDIDFMPERTYRPDTLDCTSLRKLIRRENALIFLLMGGKYRLELTYPIPILRICPRTGEYKEVKDADEILRLVKGKIAQFVDSLEEEALRQNVCPELTNYDLIGIPTREEVIDAKNWYFQNRTSNSYFDSMETEALRYIDEYNKTKQPRTTR